MTIEVEETPIKVTASFGLITLKDTELKPDDLIKLADNKFYGAKKQGRNKVSSSVKMISLRRKMQGEDTAYVT